MSKTDVRFLGEGTFGWRAMYWIRRPFVTKVLVASDTHGRSREKFIADLVNDGLGPDATVEGRELATNAFAYGVPIVVFAAWLPLLVVALIVRTVVDHSAAGAFLMVVLVVLFPFLGLGVPLSWRFWLARRQFLKWQARGEPAGERPINGSLPRALDVALGMMIGGVFSVLVIIEGVGG